MYKRKMCEVNTIPKFNNKNIQKFEFVKILIRYILVISCS